MKIDLIKTFDNEDEFCGYDVFVDGDHLMNLVQTCWSCPEQYDLESVLDGSMLAYFRVRHGYFRVDLGDCGGETIYDFSFGNGWDGNFEDEEQRIEQLSKGIEKIVERLRQNTREKHADTRN